MGRYNFNQKTQDGYEISPEQAKKWLELKCLLMAAVAVIVYRLLLLHSKRQKMVKIGQTILR